jgi:release factor glutamine methyltransferase
VSGTAAGQTRIAGRRRPGPRLMSATLRFVTIGEALRWTHAKLDSGSASPRAEAEELVSRLLALTRTEIYQTASQPLELRQLQYLERWVARRQAGEPIQYITGYAAFRDLDLRVTRDVLVPRPETEVLVEHVLHVLRDERDRWPQPRVLDLGTGSGAIALAIASEHPPAIVTGTDLSAPALEIARGNAASFRLHRQVRMLLGRWFDAVDSTERFEVVVSNPPYVADHERDLLPHDVREHEPASALFSGPTGLEALREIVDAAPQYLVPRGLLALEVADARASEVLRWLQGGIAWDEARLVEDLTGRPRAVLARRASA